VIRFSCPRCGMQLSAPKECVGRSNKCRTCGQPITVPGQRLPTRQTVPVAAPYSPPSSVPVPRPATASATSSSCDQPPPLAPVLDALPAEPPRLAWRSSSIGVVVSLGLGAGFLAAGVLVALVVVCLWPAGRGVVTGNRDVGFDPNDVERTAEWVKSLENRLRESEGAGNDLRLQRDRDEVERLLATHTGKEVKWRFRVKRVNTHSVELDTTWSVPVVFNPEFNRALDKAPGKQTNLVVFFVAFYQPVPDLDARHSTAEEMLRWQAESALGPLRESLPVGATVSPKLAARLSPGDYITLRGKVHSLGFGKTLYLSSNQATQCVLSEVSVAE
jgi:hypothetical protein